MSLLCERSMDESLRMKSVIRENKVDFDNLNFERLYAIAISNFTRKECLAFGKWIIDNVNTDQLDPENFTIEQVEEFFSIYNKKEPEDPSTFNEIKDKPGISDLDLRTRLEKDYGKDIVDSAMENPIFPDLIED